MSAYGNTVVFPLDLLYQSFTMDYLKLSISNTQLSLFLPPLTVAKLTLPTLNFNCCLKKHWSAISLWMPTNVFIVTTAKSYCLGLLLCCVAALNAEGDKLPMFVNSTVCRIKVCNIISVYSRNLMPSSLSKNPHYCISKPCYLELFLDTLERSR